MSSRESLYSNKSTWKAKKIKKKYAETYSDLVNDFPNLWLKAHVQHSVSLIKHKVRASTEVGLSCLQEVNESAWSGNADLHTFKGNNEKLTS